MTTFLRNVVFRPPQKSDPKTTASVYLRRDTTDAWTSVDPILLKKEAGIDTTLNEIRIGDGVKHWTELPVVTPQDALKLLLGAVPDV